MTLEQYLTKNGVTEFVFLPVPMPASYSGVQGGMDISGGVGGGDGCAPSQDGSVVPIPFSITVPIPIPFRNEINIHYPKRDIELAVKGWEWKGNELDYGQNVSKLRARVSESNPGVQIHAETLCPADNPLDHALIGIYAKTGNPMIPDQVLSHARHFRKVEEKGNPVAFLMGVYKQVVHDQKGQYADMFERKDPRTASILHYFADKLSQYGRDTEAIKLNKAVVSRFPGIEKEVDGGMDIGGGVGGGYADGTPYNPVPLPTIIPDPVLEAAFRDASPERQRKMLEKLLHPGTVDDTVKE